MSGLRLHLLEGFALEGVDSSVDVPVGMQRLLALLALRGSVHRCVVAGTLWPEVPERSAFEVTPDLRLRVLPLAPD